jgi:hypothetical protein
MATRPSTNINKESPMISNSPFIVPVAFAVAWVGVTWIRAHYGLPTHHGLWGGKNASVPPLFDKMMNKAMSERDQQIATLRERIEVLEKLLVDTHKSRSLSEEIEKLRNQQ